MSENMKLHVEVTFKISIFYLTHGNNPWQKCAMLKWQIFANYWEQNAQNSLRNWHDNTTYI